MTNEWHEIAKSKGWHDNMERDAPAGLGLWLVRFLDRLRRLITTRGKPTARQQLAWVALILTEWLEALDDARAQHYWHVEAPSGKPIGLLSELADVWIRCADTLGALVADIPNARRDRIFVHPQIADEIAYALGVAAEASRTGDSETYRQALGRVMYECEERAGNVIARARTANVTPLPKSFDDAIAIKTAYNKTRSYRHGGKLA